MINYLRKECAGCGHWLAGEFCGRVQFGIPCVLGEFPGADITPPEVEYFGPAPSGENVQWTKARDTQVGGDHYKKMGVQVWDVVDTWPLEQRIGYYRGGALKYLMRMGSKDQNAQEIAKGKHYMEKLLEVINDT